MTRVWRSSNTWRAHLVSLLSGGLVRVLPLPREELQVSLNERGMSGVGGSSEEEADDRCVRCGRDDNAHEMLECDSCDAGWHMCLVRHHHTPPMPRRSVTL